MEWILLVPQLWKYIFFMWPTDVLVCVPSMPNVRGDTHAMLPGSKEMNGLQQQ